MEVIRRIPKSPTLISSHDMRSLGARNLKCIKSIYGGVVWGLQDINRKNQHPKRRDTTPTSGSARSVESTLTLLCNPILREKMHVYAAHHLSSFLYHFSLVTQQVVQYRSPSLNKKTYHKTFPAPLYAVFVNVVED